MDDRQKRIADSIVRFSEKHTDRFFEKCLKHRRYTTAMVFFSLFLVSLGLFTQRLGEVFLFAAGGE